MVGEDERCGEERKAVEDAQLCVTEGGKCATCHLKSGEHDTVVRKGRSRCIKHTCFAIVDLKSNLNRGESLKEWIMSVSNIRACMHAC